MSAAESSQGVIERIVREEWARVLAVLVSQFRDIQAAEDALQDAVVVAWDRWHEDRQGLPANPRAWLLQVARRKLIDDVRRRENFRRKEESIVADMESRSPGLAPPDALVDDEAIPDLRLRLIFTCCHPALSEEARVALTLQTLGGLKTVEVARAFLVSEPTMAKRLVRAKKKIKTAGIPFEVPGPERLAERLAAVLSVLYLIFNEGYSATSGESPIRGDLCDEAIRLTRIVVGLCPEDAEVKGLLALMLLHHSRSVARVGADGRLIPLPKQDRQCWDRLKINMGLAILEDVMAMDSPGPYQIQAAISAVHAEAEKHESTDWQQIYLLYRRLYAFTPTPVVKLNGIVALSYADAPDAALEALQSLKSDARLKDYLPLYAAEADIYRRLDQRPQALAAYRRALSLAGTNSETAFFKECIQELQAKS